MPGEHQKIVMHADRTPIGEHAREYNAPVKNEIVALITGDECGSRDIIVHARNDKLTRVPDTHKHYDAMQYPLIFWEGQEGYHFNIPQVNPTTKVKLHSKKVTCMDFYACYMLF